MHMVLAVALAIERPFLRYTEVVVDLPQCYVRLLPLVAKTILTIPISSEMCLVLRCCRFRRQEPTASSRIKSKPKPGRVKSKPSKKLPLGAEAKSAR